MEDQWRCCVEVFTAGRLLHSQRAVREVPAKAMEDSLDSPQAVITNQARNESQLRPGLLFTLVEGCLQIVTAKQHNLLLLRMWFPFVILTELYWLFQPGILMLTIYSIWQLSILSMLVSLPRGSNENLMAFSYLERDYSTFFFFFFVSAMGRRGRDSPSTLLLRPLL